MHCREAVYGSSLILPRFTATSATCSTHSAGSTRPRNATPRRSGSANLAAAHAGLGGVFEELGDFDQALASLRTALIRPEARRRPGPAGDLAAG